MDIKITLIQGDITQQQVDAIVNAANESLLGGGGVNGAIHHAAGPELKAACRALGKCATGQAKLTKGYRLPARFVIHTVGPMWNGGREGEEVLLSSCYRKCLELAVKHGIKSVAFPSISTGVYGYPIKEAVAIAVETVQQFCARESSLKEVRFVCFSPADTLVYYEELTSRGIEFEGADAPD